MMDRSNFWSMQLFQTRTHFKLGEVGSEKVLFRLDITDLTQEKIKGTEKTFPIHTLFHR